MSKTIIFDGQVFQTQAWDRGMGKYSLNLLSSLYKQDEFLKKDVRIVFSKDLKLPSEAKKAIKSLCPGIKIDMIEFKLPKVVPGEDVRPIQVANKKILNKYIADLNIDRPDFMILSLFIDQYVSAFPDNANKILLFYDLIPLQYSDRYGQMWSYPNYLRKLRILFEANLVLTISQTVADDLAVYTGMDSSVIKNIDGGPIDRGHLKSTKPEIEISKNFILMPSGNDLRKNNFRAIQGFEEFRIASGKEDFSLVITSHFDNKTREKLNGLSESVVFTGNVSESELKWLYENTQALLFVSEYEGLGLPILEAAEFNKPIVCSNLTVFNEMSETAFYYVDQLNPSSIASGLETAISGTDFNRKMKQYPDLASKYTWHNSASMTLESMDKHGFDTEDQKKPRLAVVTPDPNGYSAIGKVVMLSHYSLSRKFDVDYFIETGVSDNKFTRQGFLQGVANTYPSSQLNAINYSKYDAVIYHIGNSEYHIDSIKNALHMPGYIIIHDTKLRGAFEDVLVRYGFMDTGRLEAEQKLNEMLLSEKTSYLTSVLSASLGVITHSRYASESIIEIGAISESQIARLNLPVATPKLKKLKLNSRFAVGFGGIIHRSKGLNIVDQIIARQDYQNVDLHIFGVPLTEPGELEKLESYPNVKVARNLTDFQFETLLSEMDVVISFRPNYNGETSLTVVEALRHGVIPIVRNVGWFSELPDDVVEKVEDEDEVLEVLSKLISDPELMRRKIEAAKEFMSNEYTYNNYANGIFELLHDSSMGKEKINIQISKLLKSRQSKSSIVKLIDDSRK